jgi:hypothetical protein
MRNNDMLGKFVRMVVNVPDENLGTLCDLVGKITKKEGGRQWLKELKKFLRKNPCWVGGLMVGSTEKFSLIDLGIVTVPADYDHSSCLKKFAKQNGRKFAYYNDDITDKNFPNPTRILKPGDKFRVCAFQQIVPGKTTSKERMAFLATQKAIHTGAQGLSLIFDQKRDQLPKGKYYASFDEKERLWKDADGNHRVPCVRAFSDGDFDFRLGRFGDVWYDDYAFLCFCDE